MEYHIILNCIISAVDGIDVKENMMISKYVYQQSKDITHLEV